MPDKKATVGDSGLIIEDDHDLLERVFLIKVALCTKCGAKSTDLTWGENREGQPTLPGATEVTEGWLRRPIQHTGCGGILRFDTVFTRFQIKDPERRDPQ